MISDSIRNKFVYGSILLKPDQRSDGTSGHHRHYNTLSTLRHLNEEFGRSSQLSNEHETVDSSDLSGKTHPHNQQQQEEQVKPATGESSSSSSYGRILVNPPNLSSLDSSREMAYGANGDQVLSSGGYHLGLSLKNTDRHPGDRSSARWPISGPQLTLSGRPRQQLELQHQPANAGELESSQPGATVAASDHYADDRLSMQQHGDSVAANAPNHMLIAGGETGNEFEGTWHSGPLQEIEVRQTRMDEHNPRAEIIRTPSNSREVFLID